MGYDMDNCICLIGEGMSEDIDAGRFAVLENEVKHQGQDISEIKKNTKGTNEAIHSISVSLATLTAHVEQNSRLSKRVEAVEERVDKFDLKIAAAVGAASIIAFLVDLEKVKSFFM